MHKRKSKTKPIDEYLHSVVKNESSRKNRSKLLGILLLVCAVLIIGLMWFRLGSGPSPLEVYSLNDLSIEEVSEYLEMYPAGIFINDSERGIQDTVTSLTEFLALIPEAQELEDDGDPFNSNLSLDTLTLVEEGFTQEEKLEPATSPIPEENTLISANEVSRPVTEPSPRRAPPSSPVQRPTGGVTSTSAPSDRDRVVASPTPEPVDEDTSEEEEEAFEPFEIEVSGERIQGIPLTFAIKMYDPRVSYFMDYGNGITQRVKKRHVYAFDDPGNYVIKLIAIEQSSGRRSAFAENITIMPALVEAEEVEAPVETLAVEEPTQPPVESSATPPPVGPSAVVDEQPGEPLSDRGVIDEAGTEDIKTEEAPLPAETAGPLKIVEVLPSFPGGLAALNRYIQQEQEYPRIARENGIFGKVYLQFVVTKDGLIENLQVLRGIGYGCDEEAQRLVKSMPSWVPGRQGGRNVDVLYTLPITFKLN